MLYQIPTPKVTADIQVLGTKALQLMVLVLPLGAIARVVIGPLPFIIVFIIVEVWKIFCVFCLGIVNSLGFAQLAFILDIR